VNLDYPKGREDKFEYSLLTDRKGWRKEEIEGTWFPDAFMGPMKGLMEKMNDPNYIYSNSITDAFETMKVVEAAYLSSETGGTRLDM